MKNIFGMNKIDFYKNQTTALSFFLQSLISVIVGVIMIRDYYFFLSRATTIIYVYFGFLIVMNFVLMCIRIRKGFSEVRSNLIYFTTSIVVIILVHENINMIYALIPLVMLLWLIILAISSFISYIQYRKEKGVKSLRYLFSAMLHMIYAIPFAYNLSDRLSTTIHIIGIYLVLLGVMLFIDGLSLAVPNKYKRLYKNRVRIPLPTLVATFIPGALLDRVNEYFQEDYGEDKIEDNNKDDLEANVEVFVHVSDRFRVGHVDISFDDKILSYGSYDKESIRYNGILGAGVMYEVKNKEIYTEFCSQTNNEILFGFGIALSEEELNKLRTRYEEIKAEGNIWKCKAQRAFARGEDVSQYEEYPCRLSQAVNTTFYKFHSGSYKYYWVLGTNCVRFIDDLLKASGMKTIIAGIITPGTYYTFLNNEFLNGNSTVVSRRIYCSKKERESYEVQM